MLALSLAALAFAPPAYSAPRSDVAELVERAAQLLEEHYVFPDVAARCAEHLRAELAAGRLESGAPESGFAERLTRELQAISADKHMRVSPRRRDAGRLELDPVAAYEASMDAMRRANFGFRRVEVLDGNVGYIDLRSFSSAQVTYPTLVSALGVVAGVDALIVDVRANGGGDPETVRLLCSYFFEAPTHLNSLYFRADDSTTEFWTLASMPGPKLVETPLFVLTSPFTFSAAEEFTYNLKTRGRAKIVGETTGGGANPGGQFALDDAWQLFVPTGRAINPITGTNWEGTGIAPDVEVASAQALERALGLARVAAQAAGRSEPVRQRELRARFCADAAALCAELEGDFEELSEVMGEFWDEGVSLGIVDPLLLEMLADEASPAYAVVLLEVGARHWPEVLELWRNLAEQRAERGDLEGARAALRHVLASDPHDSRARKQLEAL